jgi:hypothetical protein
MKFLIFLTTLSSIALLGAETVHTIPQGYTKITIASADTDGTTVTPKLSAISVSLLNNVAQAGASILGGFVPDTDSQAFSDGEGNKYGSQEISVSWGAAWTATEWTSERYLAYISVADDAGNADGIAPAEEAFLILENTTAGTFKIATDSDISTRFPVDPSIKIRKANSISSILANPSVPFDADDRVNFWNGSQWQSVRLIGLVWRDTSSFADANNTVVFPEEGLFIERAVASDLVLTLFGEVPSAPQIATLTDSGFLATRHPIPTAFPDLNIGNANWNDANGDRVYLWDAISKEWVGYRFLGGVWRNSVNFADASLLMVDGNSAVFVSRGSATSPENGSITPTLPYDPFGPSE